MELATLVLSGLAAIFATAAFFQGRKPARQAGRSARRKEYARHSAAYAEQLGGDGKAKLEHALGCFRLLDMADNKRRDYSDAEARLSIEAALKELS